MVSANLLLHTVMLYIFIYSMIAIFFDVSSFRQVVTELEWTSWFKRLCRALDVSDSVSSFTQVVG